MSSTLSWAQSLSTLCKLSQGMPVQGSRILMFHCEQEKKNLYSVCITSTHMCNYFTWCRHRGNGLERQCVRGEAWTVCLLNLSWGLWECWNENSGLLLLRRCFIENTPTYHPRESAGGEECGRSLNHFVRVCECVCVECMHAVVSTGLHVTVFLCEPSLGCQIENKSILFFHLIIHYDMYWNCHFGHLRCPSQ